RTEGRPLSEDEFRALEQPRIRIAVDSDVIDVVQIDARFVEAVADSDRRKASPVFDAPEAFLLGRRDKFAVDEDGGGGVGVVSVDAEDDHCGTDTLVCCGTDTLVCASPIMAAPQ